jgi:CheY-specific phosphatase CheX
MKQNFAKYVVPSVEHVLETMFFTGVVAAAEPVEDACDGTIRRTVQFEGPPDGELRIGIPSETATALASSFLGLDTEEVTTEHREQIAGELANMICGSVLSHYSPQSSFRLQVTETSPCGRECDYRVSLELPEGVLNICARVDRS